MEIPRTLNALVPQLSVVPLQLLAYYVAVDKGLDVYIIITAEGFNTLSIYLCIRILKNQNYENKGILRKGDAGL